ncbi:MAG: response regulator transcription factor [Methylococcales bacterium]|jgi:two-component system, LytTR family, response regulator AlgR|nr:response regulator transcription factor [Methylococcales bacterium]MBT7444276.1 response regulator transcription factor [Methylococcales bacterium]
MKILICDDEAPARERMTNLLSDLGDDYELIGEARNGREAIEQYNILRPDVILIDIRMPVMDGLEAAVHLAKAEVPPTVIFITAYDEHALEAFEANAVDYLLKPVRAQRLEKALLKAKSLSRPQVQAIAETHDDQSVRTHICANIRGNLQLIPVSDVIYFKAEQKYVTLRTEELEVLIEEPLKSLEQEFGDAFIRIHRNALISANHLSGLEKYSAGRCLVKLKNTEDRLEVSRRHASSIRKLLKKF